MTQSLPVKADINLVKKQAKKLLKQHRSGNADTLKTITTFHPKPESFSGLRDAQLVVARSYGFKSWAELSDAVELAALKVKTLSEKAALFIGLGCVQYNGNDSVRNYQRAKKLLAAYPEIAEFDFYTALVANNLKAVRKHLEVDSGQALVAGGPLNWMPLFYVIYSRLGEPSGGQNSLEIINLLLDCGADPNTHIILNDSYRFTALTGAMGEGELGVNQPPHHHADELVSLLLDRGASPNDGQGLYNTMFTDSGDKWLALLISKGLNADHLLNWDAVDDDSQINTLDYQLSCAVDSDRSERVIQLLDAGARPDTINTYNGRSVHTNALLTGHTAIEKILLEKGAIAEELDINDQFRLSCVQNDTQSIATLLEKHPQLKKEASLLHAAAEHCGDDMTKHLIKNDFDINGQSQHGRTLLHQFAISNDVDQIRYLLAHGAKTDILDGSYNSSAAGFAAFSGSYAAMRVLLDESDSLLDVVACAYLERASELIKENRLSVNLRTPKGNSVLHIIGLWLHDEPEDEVCKSLVDLLISAGADLHAKNDQGQTPIEFHLADGSETMAEILSE